MRMLSAVPARLLGLWAAGLVARLCAAAASAGSYDFTRHRLPTAACLDGGGLLYCDCACNHTPAYPYLSALLYQLAPAVSWVRALFLMLPAALGDAFVAVAMFALLRRSGRSNVAFGASAFYALNPVSIYELRLAHWDGLTVLALLLGLLSLVSGRSRATGVLAGAGALLKQFPLVLLAIAALKERRGRSALVAGASAAAVVVLGCLPFLLACPQTFVQSLLGHPLWQGEAPAGVGVGTVKDVLLNLGVPAPELVWALGFGALLLVPLPHVNRSSYLEFTGLVLVVLAYFTYATHRQLVVWASPFMIALSFERRVFWPLALAGAGYLARLLKPEWYFGFVHLAAGAWYYAAFAAAVRAASGARARPAAGAGAHGPA